MSHFNASPTNLNRPRALTISLMIVVAATSRLGNAYLPHLLPPNFTPILAMALFAGAHFKYRLWAYAIPLISMISADLVIGFSLLSPLIYALLLLIVAAGHALLHSKQSTGRIIIAAISSATGFFIMTNFAVWWVFDYYPTSFQGLLAAYIAGIPFYVYGTLASTVVWSMLLFKVFSRLEVRFPKLQLTSPHLV